MKRSVFLYLSLALLLVCWCAVPAGAVVLEVTMKGTVGAVMPVNNTLTVANPQKYGCTYPATGAPVCTWDPMNRAAVSGTVPDPAVFTIFSQGDSLVATSMGGTGGTWISLAKLYGPGKDGEYVTDIVGNLDSVPTPLIGDYVIDATTVPDCGKCTGTTCTALSSDVKLRSGALLVTERNLIPGGSFTYNGRNDGSSVAVTFVSGQASSMTCPGAMQLVGGVQPVSDYIVKVVPPIGFGMTQPVSVVSTTAGTTVPVTTQKAGTLPFAVLGALGVAGVLGLCAKKD
jgi:hypothetical protein